MEVARIDELAELREIAKRHRVTYRVDPAVEMVGDERVTVGYDIELIGAHPLHAAVMPGCAHCGLIWKDLDRIARSVCAPLRERLSVTRGLPFRPELTSSRGTDGKDRDEVRLALAVRHRSGYFEPVDRCEQRCLNDIVGMFRRMGVKPAQG